MRRILVTVAAAAAATAIAAAPASANSYKSHKPAGTIVDVAVKASGGGTPDHNPYDYDLLVQAVLATGLAPTLADQGAKFTVFAPNDRAFMKLVADLSGSYPKSEAEALNTAVAALGVDKIKNVLLYHVVAGKALNPFEVLLSRSLTMANGGTVKVRGITLRDETDALRDPKLVLWALNIRASNGVIHTIDRVLIPSGTA
jgi:uncharacterized surface protein with fasciclin (FAS1) repeats